MENLDIIILTCVIATLFVVFFVLMYKEFSRMGTEGYVEDPNAKKYGRDYLFVLLQRMFDDEKQKPKSKKEKEKIYKAMYRTISDMESDGMYFSEEALKKMKDYRDEMNCEYSGLPSPKAYEK